MAENKVSLREELVECVTRNLEPLARYLEENKLENLPNEGTAPAQSEFADSIAEKQELFARYFQENQEAIANFQRESQEILTKLQDSIEENEMTEDDISWQEVIIESLTKNLDLFRRYFQGEILALKITCEMSESVRISAQTDKGTWENAMAEDIPYEKITEEDRDRYKDCCYGNECIWIEFCDACSEEEVKSIMDSVCEFLCRKYGVETNLFFGNCETLPGE